MTANEFVRRIQAKVSMLSTGDIPIKLNGKDIECVIELIENGNGYYINIKQLTKDLALTWEDILKIGSIADEMEMEGVVYSMTQREYCEEILKRLNK